MWQMMYPIVFLDLLSTVYRSLLIFYQLFLNFMLMQHTNPKTLCIYFVLSTVPLMGAGQQMTIDKERVIITYLWESLGFQVSPLSYPSEGMVVGSRESS